MLFSFKNLNRETIVVVFQEPVSQAKINAFPFKNNCCKNFKNKEWFKKDSKSYIHFDLRKFIEDNFQSR
jgi:hypothetical protein